MTDLHILNAMQEMLYYVTVGVCIMTIPILIIGIILSILQAATQINEMTLTFIPKFIVMFTMLFILSPWLMHKLVLIMQNFMSHLPLYIS